MGALRAEKINFQSAIRLAPEGQEEKVTAEDAN
jgi:hypothetical protein